jgi:deoxyadenosine/deoxycytidine kinase
VRIAVSGTIGAGKSTLCAQLSQATQYEVFAEPVKSNPYLSDFYADADRWAFSAQVFMISHRFRRQMEAVHAAEDKGFILDRCFHEDRVFAEVNRDLGHINDRDWNTYLHLYESFSRIVPPPEVVIYLRVSPEKALRRISSRGRDAEVGISQDYMNRLHRVYEKWAEDMSGKTNVLSFDWADYDAPGWEGVYETLLKSVSPGVPSVVHTPSRTP